MSELTANDPDEDDELPGLLGRIRPIAKVIFGLWGLAGFAAITIGFLALVYLVWKDFSAR